MLEELRLEAETARRSSRTSLSAYASYVVGVDPAPHQDLWCELFEAVEAGAIRRLVVIAPPGHAKSTYGSIALPGWYLGRHPDHKLLISSTSDELANLYGDAVRETIDRNDRYREVFPEAIPDRARGWSRAGAFLRRLVDDGRGAVGAEKDPNLAYVGAGGSIVGRRLHGIILDDPVDESVARSETLLESRKVWVRRTLLSRLRPRTGWFIGMGTVWVEGDVLDELATSDNYVVVRMAAWSPSRRVVASVTIPDDVAWRPTRYYEEVDDDGRDGLIRR